MNPLSANSKIFSILVLNFKIIAPEFIIYEFNKHREECFKKSGLSREEFEERKKEAFEKINFIKTDKFKKHFAHSKEFSPDENDIPYFALAIEEKCAIWSNDRELKNQSQIKVFTTQDLIEALFH